jgi:hypothetical protein
MKRSKAVWLTVCITVVFASLSAGRADPQRHEMRGARMEGEHRPHVPALVWQTITNREQLAERVLAGHVVGEAGVKGLPFTAEGECEFITRLSDGNEIRSTMNTRIRRDGEGRVRLETEGMACIVDPVAARSSVMFDNAEHISQVTLAEVSSTGPDWLKRVQEEILLRHVRVQVERERPPSVEGASVPHERQAASPRRMAHSEGSAGAPGGGGVPGGGGRPRTATLPHAQENFQSESLGTMSIGRFLAEGTRTRETIAAGAMGNLLPIEIVTEVWQSPELQTIVAVTVQNPLRGNVSFRMHSLERTEPPAGLFEIPADRVVQREHVRERRPAP